VSTPYEQTEKFDPPNFHQRRLLLLLSPVYLHPASSFLLTTTLPLPQILPPNLQVIKASKELEHVLDTQFGAQGKGLHEKADTVERQLSPQLIKDIHYLATLRNKLVHEYNFNNIPDRKQFEDRFVRAEGELTKILAKRNYNKKASSTCSIM
jgi:hypothetical protein